MFFIRLWYIPTSIVWHNAHQIIVLYFVQLTKITLIELSSEWHKKIFAFWTKTGLKSSEQYARKIRILLQKLIQLFMKKAENYLDGKLFDCFKCKCHTWQWLWSGKNQTHIFCCSFQLFLKLIFTRFVKWTLIDTVQDVLRENLKKLHRKVRKECKKNVKKAFSTNKRHLGSCNAECANIE